MTIKAHAEQALQALQALRACFSHAVRRLLITLILVDAAFIAIHIAHVVATKYRLTGIYDILASAEFGVDSEGGYAEWWQHAKALAAAVFLLVPALLLRHAAVYGAWAALFAYAALDDALALHERAGAYLAQSLDLPAQTGPLRGDDFGELMFAAATGMVLIAVIAYASMHSARHHTRRSLLLLFPVAGLAVCGIGVDLLHVAVGYSFPGSYLILTVIEDGGELLFMSLGCALAVSICMAALRAAPVENHKSRWANIGSPAPRSSLRPPD